MNMFLRDMTVIMVVLLIFLLRASIAQRMKEVPQVNVVMEKVPSGEFRTWWKDLNSDWSQTRPKIP